MANLPDDVLRHVFLHLPQETLAQCRHVSRRVEPLARALLFRYTRLEVGGDVDVFTNIATSERLRPFVRELTVDFAERTQARDGNDYAANVEHRRRIFFAVPLVRLFSGLRTLNLRFGVLQSRRRDATPDDLTPAAFSSIYTEAILQCILGNWTKESQDQWERDWREWYRPREEALRNLMLEPGDLGLPKGLDLVGATQHFPDTPINLKTLTISNLSERDAEYVKSSATMRRFFETQSLSILQLLTTSGTLPARTFDEDRFTLGSKYNFTQALPSTWLSPPVVNRLRTLSLFGQELWGWCPKMDFRVLGGLPNLRTLALGMYVFSHPWQVDWIAQLGSDNGRGGLEELYLDNCPILWRGRVPGPLDSEGFPLEEVMTETNGEPAVVNVSLRWSSVLDEWRQRMPSLRVFRMGGGNWDGEFSTEVAMAQAATRSRPVRGAQLRPKWRTLDTMHINYDKPPVEDRHKYGQDIIRDGVGLTQGREYLLQYIQFEIALGSRPWVERDFKDALMLEYEDGYRRYEEARRRDEDALAALSASIDARSG